MRKMVGKMLVNNSMDRENQRENYTFKISVIVPVYNVQQYLEKCVRSLIEQTYKEIEIILVDDGSTDRSGVLCDEMAEMDERICVIHKKNGGLSSARNTGIDYAKGEYLYFVDSDDYIAKDTLKKLYDKIKQEKADLALCGIAYIDENGHTIKEILPYMTDGEVWNEEQFWKNRYIMGTGNICYAVAWNKLYRRTLFQNERYDVGKLHEDEYICHRIISQCSRIAIVNEVLYYYLQRDNSIMGQKLLASYFYRLEADSYRFEYFRKAGYKQLEEFVLFDMSSLLRQIYRNKEKLDESQVKRLKEENKKNRRNYWNIVKGKHSLRYWGNFGVTMLGLKLCVFLIGVYNKYNK